MTFPLFQFVTPYAAAPDPVGAGKNLVAASGNLMEKNLRTKQMAQQDSQFKDTLGLHQSELDLRRSAQSHTEDEDAAGMVMRYNQFLANGDDASAQSLAPAMKQMGIDLVPRPGATGVSPQDWQSQVKPAAAAEPLPDIAPEAEPAKPAPKANVPPLLSKFMTAAPQAAPAQEAPVDERAASAERIRSIGGTPPEPKAIPEAPPQGPVSPGSAEVEAAANPDLPVGKPQLPSYEVMYRGKSMGVIDPNLFHGQHKDEANRRGQAFVDSLPKDAANQFFPGLNDAATGKEQEDTIKNDMGILLQGMRSAGKGKGGGDPNAVGADRAPGTATADAGIYIDPKERARLDTQIRQWTQNFVVDNATKQLAQTATALEDAEAKLRSDLPADQRVGIASIVKSLNGANSSDKEADRIMSAAGGLSKWMSMVDNWVASGKVDPALTQGLARMAQLAHKRATERAAWLAGRAADGILNDPLSGGNLPADWKPYVRQHIVTTITGEGGGDPNAGKPVGKPSVLK